MSKGSKQRPRTVSEAEWYANWERVFGEKNGSKKKKNK
jgi:hypothetical protein